MFVSLKQSWANCNPGAEALHTCCLCPISCCPCRVELSLQRAGNPVVHKAKNIDHLALYRLSLLALGLQGVQMEIVLMSSLFVLPREFSAVRRAEPSLVFCKARKA